MEGYQIIKGTEKPTITNPRPPENTRVELVSSRADVETHVEAPPKRLGIVLADLPRLQALGCLENFDNLLSGILAGAISSTPDQIGSQL